MKKIKLTQGKYTLVDDADFEWLNQWKWHAIKNYNKFYALRTEKEKNIRMHRFILNPPFKKEIDHINGDGLDNRRENLRICTHSENLKNREKQSNNLSGFKGVCWNKSDKRWVGQIFLKGKKCIYLGFFKTKEEAALAYNQAAKKYFGEFAKLNNLSLKVK